MAKQVDRRTGRVTPAGVLRVAVRYLDDLLALASGGCFVAAAYELAGTGWAKAVAGCCLMVYAIVVARARREVNGPCC